MLKYAQQQHVPLHEFTVGTMHGFRTVFVGDEEPHGETPQGGLLFTLEVVSPVLKNTVFPLFFESEQCPEYGDDLREEPRDP